MPTYKHHQRHLVPDHCREQYGQQVFTWLDRALHQLRADNQQVTKGGRRVFTDDYLPCFEFAGGAVHIALQFGKPSDLLLRYRTVDKTRQELVRIAKELMREARPADANKLRQRFPRRAK